MRCTEEVMFNIIMFVCSVGNITQRKIWDYGEQIFELLFDLSDDLFTRMCDVTLNATHFLHKFVDFSFVFFPLGQAYLF